MNFDLFYQAYCLLKSAKYPFYIVKIIFIHLFMVISLMSLGIPVFWVMKKRTILPVMQYVYNLQTL
jgi:hypothetical protein